MSLTRMTCCLALAAVCGLGVADDRATNTGGKASIGGTAAGGGSVKAPLEEIIVVCKTHFDIGYTHRVREIVQYYRTEMIDKALAIMDASADLPQGQRFAWTAPAWVMSKVLDDWPGQSPARRRKLDEAFRAGRFVTHALPFTLESDACEAEEMARGLAFGTALTKRYGLPLPRSGKVTDVPSHCRALATALAGGGVRFLHVGCNWPAGYVRVPNLFWWEGPDGSRVLTFYSPIYGTVTALWPGEWLSPVNRHKEMHLIGEGLLPPANWPHKTWAAILVTPDNSGPPTAAMVRELFADAAKKLPPSVKVRMGTMDEFVAAVLREHPSLPVVKAEMPDNWIHGIMSDPGGIKLSREAHPLIASAEALHTQLGLWGAGQPAIATEVALAYEKILLYGEHTWGISPSVNDYGDAFKTTKNPSIAALEASWEDKTDYIRAAAKIAREIQEKNLRTLAAAVRPQNAGDVVVYNPLPWKRSGVVEVGGEPLRVADVPPCGYKVCPCWMPYAPAGATVSDTPRTIENDYFKITLDPVRCRVSSLVDKRTNRQWVDPSAAHGLGQYLNERFTLEQTQKYAADNQQGRAVGCFGVKGDWLHPGMHKPGMVSEKEVPYRAASPAGGTLKITADGDSQTAVLETPGNAANHLAATSLRATLYKGEPFVELEITIKDKARDNWPEADWLCLPLKIAAPTFRVGRPLGMMDPAEILPGANRHLYTVGHGVTIADADGSGMAVCPIDHPLVSLDRPGCWKFSMDFVPKKPAVYLNLFNNQWNTNFRYWYPGTWSSRVRLWTFDSKTAAADVLARPALEARNPLAVVRAAGNGSLPRERSGVAVSRVGVIVTALGANPDGPGTLLRVWEQAGCGGELVVTLPEGAKFNTAAPVNLRGEPAGRPIAIENGAIRFTLRAYAPASFVLD